MNDARNDQDPLKTICVLAMGFMVLGLAFKVQVLLYVALCLLVIGSFMKTLACSISRAWLRLSLFIGLVNTKIILTLVYFLLLTPLAYGYRLSHGDFLGIKRDKGRESYFTKRNKEYQPKDLENLW